MRDIANRFSDQMDKICDYIDLITAVIKLTKVSQKKLYSKHNFVVSAIRLVDLVQQIGNFTPAAYDGAYLTACAEYELVVRDFIETYMEHAVQKCQDYHHLPQNMREWYPEGCAKLILSLREDRFKHLTKEAIINSLASCVRPSKSKGYVIIGDAFSNNEKNFWPSEIEVFFKRIGVEKVWQKLSREPNMKSALGIRNDVGTEQRAKIKLEEILIRRNHIIHRGKTYYTSSESEVRECVTFFKDLITNLAEVMEKQIESI